MISFDDGNGPGLFAAGYFSRAGAFVNANSIAVWRNGAWSEVGGGVRGADGSQGEIEALLVFDDGRGPALYACGSFAFAGGRPASCIARWNGTLWSSLGSGLQERAASMAAFDDGGGPALFVAGRIRNPTTGLTSPIARWNGRSWTRLAGGTPSGEWINYTPCPIRFCPIYVPPSADALAVFDPGFGPGLFLAGSFSRARGTKLSSPAEWDGRRWGNLAGGGVDGRILTLTTHDDGMGEALYAGGFVSLAGGLPANGVAKWDGAAWEALGEGVGVGPVAAMLSFDDGSGPALYVGGNLTSAGNTPTGYIARWKCDE